MVTIIIAVFALLATLGCESRVPVRADAKDAPETVPTETVWER